MNRPPGQGYPYDQPTPKPAEYNDVFDPFAAPPTGRIQCGYPLADDGSVFCRNSAPCPIHRNMTVGQDSPDAAELKMMPKWTHLNLPGGTIACGAKYPELHSAADLRAVTCPDCIGSAELADTEAQLNAATPEKAWEGDGSFDDVAATGTDEAYEAMRDPAPGLYQTMTGKALPSFAEMRERYGDPADLKPIPKYDPDAPADLHDQLHKDDQPWSVRSRLQKSLGRRALATRLADALPPLLGAELADRLDTIVTQALTEQEAAVTQEISDRYHEARARLDADAQRKLQEVHDERFRGRASRLD